MKYILIGCIRVYQLLPFRCHSNCKFIPTCSNYGIEAINEYGSIKGSILTIKRIIKCNPLSKGGYDPVIKRCDKMKKIKLLSIILSLLFITACNNNTSMENITISTSVYPIEYVVNTLYGEHSTINSIYPSDSEAINFEVTDTLLDKYSDSDMFIFNGLSDEKEYVKYMTKGNKDLKIIDVTSNMYYENSIEELWLDPNKLLTIANNIRKGFDEYIDSTYLVNEINENYNNLKIELTTIDGRYYSTVKNASNNVIIISDNAFAYLKKYGVEIISLDPDTVTSKDISDAKKAINNGTSTHIYIKYGEEVNDTIKNVIGESNTETVELYTMTNLYNINIEKNNYSTLINQNLENLKLELYK